jgi:hypothetical protein
MCLEGIGFVSRRLTVVSALGAGGSRFVSRLSCDDQAVRQHVAFYLHGEVVASIGEIAG